LKELIKHGEEGLPIRSFKYFYKLFLDQARFDDWTFEKYLEFFHKFSFINVSSPQDIDQKGDDRKIVKITDRGNKFISYLYENYPTTNQFKLY